MYFLISVCQIGVGWQMDDSGIVCFFELFGKKGVVFYLNKKKFFRMKLIFPRLVRNSSSCLCEALACLSTSHYFVMLRSYISILRNVKQQNSTHLWH